MNKVMLKVIRKVTFLFVKLMCLCVSDAPVITTNPQPQSVVAGGRGTFSCAAHYYPSNWLNVQWYKDGNTVQDSSSGSFDYTIASVSEADRGNYKCNVCNTVGCISSNTALLDVRCEYSV